MKKLITLIVAAAMILSMIPVMAIGSSAADVEGDWTTYRSANDYPGEDDEDDGEEKVYKPEAGYEYTSEGFTVVPADYKDTTPFMTVQSKEAQPIKDGIYIQFRVDDYSYGGGTGADHWMGITLNSEAKPAPGSTKHGGGWVTLIRGEGNGTAQSLPHLTKPGTKEAEWKDGAFWNIGATNVEVPVDDEGREIYTFEVKWDGSAYEMLLNGVSMPGSADSTKLLESVNANGEYYIGITLYSQVKDGTAALTILKYGTSEADATTPVGSDSKEPEENQMTIAPIADSSTIEANMPAILWNPETVNLKSGNNCVFTALGDNTWRVTATAAAVFFGFTPKRSWSYDATDFPVFGIMLRNAEVIDSGTLWYAAGEVMSAQNDCILPFSVWDGEFYESGDDEYIFVPVDISDLWEGRINSIRLDFALNEGDEFDICFAGMFRSEDEAKAYAGSYLTALGIDPTVTEEETTEAPADDTQAPDTQAPGAQETNAAETNASTNAGSNAGSETTAGGDEGCSSVIGMGAVAVLAAVAAAVALKKKD